MPSAYEWNGIHGVPSRSYRCGHCGREVASDDGWQAKVLSTGRWEAFIYVCHQCSRPTFIDESEAQLPGVATGNSVSHVSDPTVEALYEEARRCTAASSPTAAVLCCRKLLMHIAVDKGAPKGKSFVDYVKYLADSLYVPPDAIAWVDHIRTTGNEANHEIVISSKADAEELLAFAEMLLKIIYEFPARAALRKPP